VLSNVLVAATAPDDVRDAAAWSRANPQLSGEAAVRAIEPYQWHPAVKALVAFPELLARMAESPQWTADLGAAFVVQEPQVMETVQALRRRAQASGYLQSNDQYSVQQQGPAIAIYPAQPQVIYVPYYDPYVVYGPWWWYSYRPVFWRPWYPRPAVFVSATFVRTTSVDWHRRHVISAAPGFVARQQVSRDHWREHREPPRQQAAPVTIHNHANPNARPIVQGAQIPRQNERRDWREQRREQPARQNERRDGREQRADWREQRREQRLHSPVQNQVAAAPAPAQVQRQEFRREQRVEAPRQTAQVQQRPVVVQQRMHEAQAPRGSFQGGGHFQQHGQGQSRGQGNQHRGGRS
jgi:Protein of unknown function (DUF3300)